MNKNPNKPEVSHNHRFLMETPIDDFPKVNPRFFIVLALIRDGYTQRQIVAALEGRVHRTTVTALLVTACDRGFARFEKINNDRRFVLRLPGEHLLAAYLLVMKNGVV